jgi:transposase InsO family protein
MVRENDRLITTYLIYSSLISLVNQKGVGQMKLTARDQIRIDVLVKYTQGNLKIHDAIAAFEVGERQFRRIVKRFREEGVQGVIHGNRNKSPANKTPLELEYQIRKLYSSKYYDFNVSHFLEKLHSEEKLQNVPSYAVVRKILLQAKLIEPTQKKTRKAYARRKRYSKEGLMIQIDGSHHHWIRGHEPFCLTAAIDDATGKIVGAKFTPTETTFAAMDVVESIIQKHGLFQILYSDKAGIYGGGKRVGYTNMDRAMSELGILSIQANTPQGKGRIERLFSTLQSRLIAEMRLAGINSIEKANAFLESVFIENFNKQFGKCPTSEESGFVKFNNEKDLNEVFTMREVRVVQNGNVINYQSKSFVLHLDHYLGKKAVEIRHYRNGDMKFWLDGIELSYGLFDEDKNAA